MELQQNYLLYDFPEDLMGDSEKIYSGGYLEKTEYSRRWYSFSFFIKYTVLGRAVTSEPRFVLAAAGSNEFFREMLMNCFLYFPFGLTLGEVQRRKVWSGAFFVSLLIEIWQFMAGTGVAQGTDLLCNTIGAVLGSGYSLENFGLSSILKKKRKDFEISKSNVEKNGKNSVEKDRKKEVRRW